MNKLLVLRLLYLVPADSFGHNLVARNTYELELNKRLIVVLELLVCTQH